MSEKAEKTMVRIQTTIPILAIIFGCIATGKFISDVAHIRLMMEEQGRTIQNTVNRFDDLSQRTARIEAYLGFPNNRSAYDGTRRNNQ